MKRENREIQFRNGYKQLYDDQDCALNQNLDETWTLVRVVCATRLATAALLML